MIEIEMRVGWLSLCFFGKGCDCWCWVMKGVCCFKMVMFGGLIFLDLISIVDCLLS